MTELARIRALLAEREITPNRALGQNFLVDDGCLAEIARAAEGGGMPVLEIGPGLGSLTRALLPEAAAVLAVEKDARLAEILRETLPDPRLTVVTRDFLDADVPVPAEDGGYVVAANLPYYVTTLIAEKLLRLHPLRMTLMVQAEAAGRFFAAPSDRVYGPLAVTAAAYYRAERILDAPRSSFFPQPDVDSTVVRLTRRDGAPALPPARLLGFCKLAFAMRRKTIQNNLKSVPGAADALETLGIPPTARVETLPPETLLALAQLLDKEKRT